MEDTGNTEKDVRQDPEDDNFVYVLCEYCGNEHRIEKRDWKACLESLENGHTAWYMTVYENGSVKQTSHFKNIKVFAKNTAEQVMKELLNS